MSSGFDRLGPMPIWFRRCFKAISAHEASKRIKQGVRATVPASSDVMFMLEGGDFLLMEACRDEQGRVQLGYHFSPKEVHRESLARHLNHTKEVSHAGSRRSRNTRNASEQVA